MAITPTGAIYKALYFDGVSSRDFGVYITGEAVYNAPKREVEMISIPGRNGDLALDKGRFENIPVTYPAGIFANNEEEFAKAISEFRNFLCSRKGYVRLTDEYNADEYRMAVYKEGLEVDAKNLQAGEFNIVFNCKPQRWLTSGEELVDMDDWREVVTESGELVEFEATDIMGIKSLSTDFSASQDGTPWQSETESAPYVSRPSPDLDQDYFNEFDTIVGGTVAWNQLTPDANTTNTELGEVVSVDDAVAGNANDLKVLFVPVQDLSHGDPSPDNICPITGYDDVKIYVSPTTDEEDATLYVVELGETRYGGTLDVTTGELKLTKQLITFDGTEDWIDNTGNSVSLPLSGISLVDAPGDRYIHSDSQYDDCWAILAAENTVGTGKVGEIRTRR